MTRKFEPLPATENPTEQARIRALVGHPEERYALLSERIQTGIRSFAAIEEEFLALIWCIDTYRINQVIPQGMGNKKTTNLDRKLGAIYRGKGNYFSGVAALILGEMTTSRLASRNGVQGFSQTHQIDIAWPARDTVPLISPEICCEAKLTGAPGFDDTGDRGSAADWTNRRKEMKFQASDLKLARHAANTSITHWDVWRQSAPPLVYVLWGARVTKPEEIVKMVKEARDLTDTYLDGVGIYAFQISANGEGYEPSPIAGNVGSRVTSLDNVLATIAAQINTIMSRNNNKVPPPATPPQVSSRPPIS